MMNIYQSARICGRGTKIDFEINTRTLKAIKLSPEEVQLLRKAARATELIQRKRLKKP